MKLAERAAQIKPSATLSVSTKAMELRAKGKDILSLSVGEPDFPTPAHICKAAKEAIDAGFTRYTPVPGIPELRTAAARYFNKFYGTEAEAEHVIIGNGGKHCLYNLCQALLNPGDQVLIPAPYWVSYPAMVELAGAKPVVVPSTAENNFKIGVEDLERSRTPKTRLLFLNSPSNPTGVCYSRAELDAVAAWAVEHGVIVVSDEIYDQLVYKPAEAQSLAPWWSRHPELFVVVNGVAKTFAMTGWRVGYALGHPDLIKAMSRLQGQSTSNVCSISQKAAVAALTGPFGPVDEMRVAFERRRNLALEIISSWPGVVCPKPDGAVYLCPDVHERYSSACPDSTSLCTRLLDEAGVALVPGVAFGDDRCIRVSYAVSDETLTKALHKVAKILLK